MCDLDLDLAFFLLFLNISTNIGVNQEGNTLNTLNIHDRSHESVYF